MAQPLRFEGFSVEDKAINDSNEMQPLARSMSLENGEKEEGTVYFKDGKRKIDFVLTFEKVVKEAKKLTAEELSERQLKREKKRNAFLATLEKGGIEHEIEIPKNSQKFFVKIHATFRALEKGAEELLLRMPIKDVDLPRKDLPWYRDMFNTCKVRDPFTFFDPKIPKKFIYKDCFTAPYSCSAREDFIGIGEEDNFFSSAQRIAITNFIMENTHYGTDEDQVGISRLIGNKSFSAAYPLHDGSYRTDKGKEFENERQLLYREWSHPRNWYKYQPLENIRHYFGEKIGLYFVWVGFYTYWLLWASILGIIITICGLYTAASDYNPIVDEICDENYREFFYMCPPCDETCDFWYYRSGCTFAHFSLLFDYGGTVFFAAFMALWAVLFLEFWKRTEAQLQYEWDTIGYEAAEERERPHFIQTIKRKIRHYPEEKKKKYKIYNPVLERDEYIQPNHLLLSKISTAFSILMTMVAAVIGVVFAVIIYRLAVSTYIYRLVRRFPGGPTAADLITSITGSVIQLMAIIVMNQIYERLASWLTKWELHRTNTEYEDSFTLKMYLFQFINFYSSLFYISFFKGNFTGYPGSYLRVGPFRLDECPTYGCLFELTIQLAIIFVGKQILNDILELGKPYFVKIIKVCMRRRQEKAKETTRWGKDLVLVPPSVHGLFFEYIELVIQYGFVTIFVTAFPLAPFFAWLNNVIEIRLDAHKFVQILRRPVAERAQDIGAWFYLLNFTTSLCVITNAFLIAVTSQFINFEVFNRVFKDDPQVQCSFNDTSLCSDGVVAWSTSPFDMTTLLSPLKGTNQTRFPVLTVMSLPKYVNGEMVTRVATVGDGVGDKETVLYLPFIDFDCLKNNLTDFEYDNFTESEFRFYNIKPEFQVLTLQSADGKEDGQILSSTGPCFIDETECRFRGQIENDKYPLKYWQTIAAKLAFVIVFEHVIFLIGIVLDKLIPDVPRTVTDEIRREKYLASKISLKVKQLDDKDKAKLEEVHSSEI